MNEENRPLTNYTGYEYKEICVDKRMVSFYIDGYENFGWIPDSNAALFSNVGQAHTGQVVIRMKRDRKIGNKTELTRLQQHFEACVKDIRSMESAKTSAATMWALITAVFGTAFMAGATFACIHEPPIIWLCILLAIPGFIGWIIPWFLYQYISLRKSKKLQPLIDEKYEEIYQICEKGHSLL